MSDLDALAVGEPPPPYMIFLVVFLFFVTGLLGFLVCHTLKKRGYRCRTWETDEEEEEEEEDKEKEKEGKKEEVSAEGNGGGGVRCTHIHTYQPHTMLTKTNI